MLPDVAIYRSQLINLFPDACALPSLSHRSAGAGTPAAESFLGRDRLALMTERFPKLPGEMQIADLAAPEGHELGRKISRMAFRDRFRRMLAREYPEWRIEDLSSEPNLEQSLTPSYVRAASIIHMNRDSWRESHTWVWLTDDRQLRVLETPEAILEALG